MIDPRPASSQEPLSSDTSLEAEARQLQAWRAMSSIEIARTIRAAWSAGQRIAWIGLQERFPHADADELRVRLAVQTLGRDLAHRIHPQVDRYPDA